MDSEALNKAINEFDEEQKKYEIALEIADGEPDKAKQLMSGEIKDIVIVKATFSETSLNLYGAFIFYMNLNTNLIDRIFATVTFHKAVASISPYIGWQEFEKKIIELEWAGHNMSSQSVELISNLRTLLGLEYLDKFISGTKERNISNIKEVIYDIILKALNLTMIKLDVDVEFINKYFMKISGLFTEEKREQRSKEKRKKEEIEEVIKPGEELLEATLEISPIHGINITKLQPGMRILVKIIPDSPRQKHYIKLLNVSDGKKIVSIEATVRYIKYDDLYGYMIIAEVAPGIVVRCIEQAQINIMTPEHKAKEEKGKLIKSILIITGALLILLIILYIYLTYKGII